jgi:hypothetical protein
MQSATSIQLINERAKNTFNQGGQSSVLTVDFRVSNKGPAHVAGIIFSPDFWGSRKEGIGTFQRFEGDSEVWQAAVSAPGFNVKFEYVIFCDDFRGVNTVPRIYNTNGGETFRPVASF